MDYPKTDSGEKDYSLAELDYTALTNREIEELSCKLFRSQDKVMQVHPAVRAPQEAALLNDLFDINSELTRARVYRAITRS